jgi:radical SAM superfamily enzyme YgiQ (UPF0313 family)
MDILLINPPLDFDIYENEFGRLVYRSTMPNLGLLYNASALVDKGYKVEVIDFEAENYSEEKINKYVNYIDAVGITINAYTLKNSAKISALFKQKDKDLKIIIGGPLCSIQPKQTLNDSNADICVRGEGERVIGKIVEAINGKRKYDTLPGVYYKKNNEIKNGPPSEIIKDLDSISFPARHLVEKYEYGLIAGVSATKRKVASMVTTRGCPYGCKFCCVTNISKSYRMRSIENVIEELEELNNKYKSVFILDDNFLIDKKRAIKIMDLIIEKKYDFEFWVAGVRADAADEELFKKMKKAGVKTIGIGIESGNQDVLDFYNKRITIDDIKKAVKLSRKAGFYTQGNFIVGAPIETKEHLEKTYKMATKLPLDIAFFSSLQYYKGSELWNDIFNEGKVKEDEYLVKADSKRGLSNFTYEELERWCTEASNRFFMRPKFVIDQIIQSFIRKDFSIFKKGMQYITSYHRWSS